MATLTDGDYGPVIDGHRRDGRGARMESVDPATEETITTFAVADPTDVDDAVTAATAAARSWGRAPWTTRAGALRELAAAIEAHAEEFALLDTRDSGNPLATMRADVADSANRLRLVASLGTELKGETQPYTGELAWQTYREPYGVVGRIVPFNHPLKFAVVKCAAPLLAGNAVVLKPSEATSLTALRLGELAADCLPPGVFNVLPGDGSVGAAIVEHPGVPRVAFTGSVATGQAVLRGAATHIKHATVELGGKNPLIIHADVDPSVAAEAAVTGLDLRRSPGQACWSTSRVFVHADIENAVLGELEKTFAELAVTEPTDPGCQVGPVAYRQHYERVLRYIDAGVREGATLRHGGKRPDHLDKGYYVEPTLFGDVTADMTVAREEIFGPVLSVLSWTDEEEMLAQANDSDLGLTAAVWSNDLRVARRNAHALEAGMVWVNALPKRPVGMPFGGYKHSGLGKEGNLGELLSYTQEKAIITAEP